MEYARTRDILNVLQVLCHKNIKNILFYAQLINFKDDEFITKLTHSEEEICQLIEGGFGDVCDFGNNKVSGNKSKASPKRVGFVLCGRGGI